MACIAYVAALTSKSMVCPEMSAGRHEIFNNCCINAGFPQSADLWDTDSTEILMSPHIPSYLKKGMSLLTAFSIHVLVVVVS